MEFNDFKNIVFPHRDKIYRLALRMLGSSEDAKDIVQEVIIKLWTKPEILKKYSNPLIIALLITKNLSIDKLKSKYRSKRKIRLDEIDFDIISPQKQPDKLLEDKDASEVIKNLIDSLPPKVKMVFHLREIEELSYEEISKITKINESTVKVIVSRARKKLKEILINKYKYEYHEN